MTAKPHELLEVRHLKSYRPPPETDYREAMRQMRRGVLHATQDAVAHIAGVSESTVSRWEAGVLTPTAEAVHRLKSYAEKNGLPMRAGWPHNHKRRTT